MPNNHVTLKNKAEIVFNVHLCPYIKQYEII